MLKELYNDFRESGYKLGDKMGQLSQRLVGKLPFAYKLSDAQKAYPGAFAAAYMGAAFASAFALSAVIVPVMGAALVVTGKAAVTFGGLMMTVGGMTILGGLAAFSKGVMDGGEKHIGFIAEARALIKDIRAGFIKMKKETAPAALQSAPAVAPAQAINAAPAGEAFKNASLRSEAPANDDKPAANAARNNAFVPKPRG